MKQKQPLSGEVWSLHLPPGMEHTPAPLVLLVEKSNESWTAAPVFDGDLAAGHEDVRISKDVDFLDGHCWAAAKSAFSVGAAMLWNYLDRIPSGTLEQVKSFRTSGICSLASGRPLIPDLTDPRIKVRDEILKLVDLCVKEAAPASWVLVIQSARKRIKAFKQLMGQAIEDVTVTLSNEPRMPGFGDVRGVVGLVPSTMLDAARAAFNFMNGGQVHSISVTVGGREIRLSVVETNQIWNVGISVVDMPKLSSVSLERNGETIDCAPTPDGKWWPAAGELEPGRYIVRLKDENEMISFPMELGQALAS